MINEVEKHMQEGYEWEREKFYKDYSTILGGYQAKNCIENVQGSSILDLACGDGTITKIFSQNYERIVGVDASDKHLKKAKERVPKGLFFESLIEEFNIDKKFDGVFMLNLLEHVENPREILQKAVSFLKEEGVLIVHVPNCDAINRRISVNMGTLISCDELSSFDINVVGHRRSYNMESLEKEISEAGLKVIKTGGIFYKMLSTPQMDWFLQNGLWEDGGFGWGRVGSEKQDWKQRFCDACYEIGKENPKDCNIIYAVIKK